MATINTPHAPGQVREISVPTRDIEQFCALVGTDRYSHAMHQVAEVRKGLNGRSVWNVNSTATGGGVAEMLWPVIGYARHAGIDARWLVVEGSPAFFRLTKRVHHALHGSEGDGSPLDAVARATYEDTLSRSVPGLLQRIAPGDIVILHDPQTLGLAPALTEHRALVVWRCHVGADSPNPETADVWSFLSPYLESVQLVVASRPAHIPPGIEAGRAAIIQPSIDPFSAKNRDLSAAEVDSILADAGVTDPPATDPRRQQRISISNPVSRLIPGEPLRPGTPFILQVSRWDPLKNFEGLLNAFDILGRHGAGETHLVLAGPSAGSVADDPEAAATLENILAVAAGLPAATRERVHVLDLPMADVTENAYVVNALQRSATIVVQNSRREGFGLTVTEAMWKARPVVATRTGGIQDQITSGQHGKLVHPGDDHDLATAIASLLGHPGQRWRLGRQARSRASASFLALNTIERYAALLGRIEAIAQRRTRAA